MPIPEAMEHKKKATNCGDCPYFPYCDDVECPKDKCAPDCPQCLNIRWAKWVLERFSEHYFNWKTARLTFTEPEIEALKKLASEA